MLAASAILGKPVRYPRRRFRARVDAGGGKRGQESTATEFYITAIRRTGINPASPNPVYVVNLDGRIVYANDAFARITKYAVRDLIGRLSVVLYAPEATPLFLMRRQRALRGAAVRATLRTTLQCRDATRVAVDLTVRTLRRDKQIAGRVAVLRAVDGGPSPKAGSKLQL